jgi:hypothetical protein
MTMAVLCTCAVDAIFDAINETTTANGMTSMSMWLMIVA